MELEFWVEGDHDVWAEYKQIRVSRPDVGKAIRNAITLVRKDPDTAEQDYSVRLDPDAGYLGLPFESPNGLTCLTWRPSPDGYDTVQVIDFSELWTDLPMPPVWPRPKGRNWWRLGVWASIRLLWCLIILAWPIIIWTATYQDAKSWSSTTATVESSYWIKSASSEAGRQLNVMITFIPAGHSAPIRADVEPNTLTIVHHGQRIPVRYRQHSAEVYALYAGPGGDVKQENYFGDYVTAAVVALFAAIPLLVGAFRLSHVIDAARGLKKTRLDVVEVSSSRWLRRVRTCQSSDGPDLEWRVLRFQRRISGTAQIGGSLGCGHWLVIQQRGKQFIWPASRAQPVIGKGMRGIPRGNVDSSLVIDAHHRLLAGYAQIISQTDRLPFIVRRRPGQQLDSEWWWLGAPRPLIQSLVAAHIRRRLRVLGNGLTRMAVLSKVSYSGTSRSTLHEASEECRALAGTLPRSAWRAATAFMLTIALPVGLTTYTAFVQAPPIHIRWGTSSQTLGLLIAVSFILISPFVFTRAVQCKRVMFRPAIGVRAPTSDPSALNEEWDVYQFEREAFLQASLKEPSEWEGHRWIRWLGIEVYALAIGVPILIAGGPLLFGKLILLVSGVLALLVIMGALEGAGGVRPLIQFLKERGRRF